MSGFGTRGIENVFLHLDIEVLASKSSAEALIIRFRAVLGISVQQAGVAERNFLRRTSLALVPRKTTARDLSYRKVVKAYAFADLLFIDHQDIETLSDALIFHQGPSNLSRVVKSTLYLS
ncbi:hypothetical protein PM082_016918 [Marasmius tenuissimus]|nr:hypothetical protein PM082_016918 [Marasmius tenuissimus]